MNLFFADIKNENNKSWNDLINDLNQTSSYNPYCCYKDYYSVFRHIIVSLLLDKEVILLDSDFSEEEIANLTGSNDISETSNLTESCKVGYISTKEELLSNIGQNLFSWNLTLFTSGTTGIPKKIRHSFQTITRFVKKSQKNKNNIWGFAYNPTHMAGVQVFFQALLNGNTIIRLFGLSSNDIFKSVTTFNISHISATPTFYRLLPVISNKQYFQIKRITSGGEKFDSKTINNLSQLFPNAKITNVYASTEAGSLFASKGDVFSIKPNIKDLVKVENNELLIHKSLLGRAEFETNNWYNSGDLVEVINIEPLQIKFISRKNEMINVGGYKVNPNEVEEVIREIKEVTDVRVFAKKNSVLGNIVCCEIVKNNDEISETAIRSFLQKKIQEFKIPRVIKFTDSISLTRTGKIKRT